MADSESEVMRVGNHVYINAGGIFNKHGIVYKNNGKDVIVAYYDKSSKSIVCCPLKYFANGNTILLYAYGVSYLWELTSPTGSCSRSVCVLPRQVVKNVLYYSKHPKEVDLLVETHQNWSECFATACTSRTSLVAETDDSLLRVNDFFTHKVQPNDLTPGDHIYVYRLFVVYSHHAIYIGRNESGIHTVIHFTGDSEARKSKSTAKIRKATLDDFLKGADLRLVSYDDLSSIIKRSGSSHALKSRHGPEVVEIAEHYCRNPHEWKDYHVFSNNCEHFCIFCKTGKKVRVDIIVQDQWCTIQ